MVFRTLDRRHPRTVTGKMPSVLGLAQLTASRVSSLPCKEGEHGWSWKASRGTRWREFEELERAAQETKHTEHCSTPTSQVFSWVLTARACQVTTQDHGQSHVTDLKGTLSGAPTEPGRAPVPTSRKWFLGLWMEHTGLASVTRNN